MVALKCKQIFCLIYSGLLFISGLILILFSIYFSYKLFNYYTFAPSNSIGPFILLLVLGIIHLFISWLGVNGPEREHDFHIILFLVLSLILFLTEFATTIWIIVVRSSTRDISGKILSDYFHDMVMSNNINKVWVNLQDDFKCCGMNGPTDYTYVGTCTHGMDGCKDPLIKYLKRVLLDGAILSFLISLFHIVGLVIFYLYFKALKNARVERLNRRMALQREISGGNIVPAVPVAAAPPLTTAAEGNASQPPDVPISSAPPPKKP